MRLLILGATGGTGRELTNQAIKRGYSVTAFVRSSQKLGSVGHAERVRAHHDRPIGAVLNTIASKSRAVFVSTVELSAQEPQARGISEPKNPIGRPFFMRVGGQSRPCPMPHVSPPCLHWSAVAGTTRVMAAVLRAHI